MSCDAKRDPRVDPIPGDVFRDGMLLLEVDRVADKVYYRLTTMGAFGIRRIPIDCTMSMRQWKRQSLDWVLVKEGGAK